MTQTMAFVKRLFLIMLCVRMLMAATLEKMAATDDSDLRPKCPGEQMCACITESNSCTRCEVNCNADCNDLTTDGTKCFSELACYPKLLFEVDHDYNGEQCRDSAATTTTSTRPSCVCNGQHDFIGLGGSCQAGLNGYWCYVDGEADCDNKESYNGHFISVSPCIGKTTTTHCSWGEWSSWGSCSATCGGGSQYATRNMAKQATGGGELCKGSPVKIQQCGRTDCPTDCVWGEWSSWTSCSATCGGGTQIATRSIEQHATGGGELCRGYEKMSQECGRTDCPTNCVWGDWSSWSSCSATCGGGTQLATRRVAQQATAGGEQCRGSEKMSQECGRTDCPTDCVWGDWGSWSRCTATCGGGTQFTTRRVAQHATAGGEQCKGSNRYTDSCNRDACDFYDYYDYYDVGGCLLGFCAGVNIG